MALEDAVSTWCIHYVRLNSDIGKMEPKILCSSKAKMNVVLANECILVMYTM